ncbi:MAG TPA: hypothetical protein VFK79_06515 [Xanthobacteraceae bacterium]|nr:hypothetical protein [Xanthobacteraceae bacterium]
MNRQLSTIRTDEPALAQKVAFLSRPATYPSAPAVTPRETHMSWVFLAGDTVYKLKKPVRFSYLNFSTLERRRAACQAELRLNRRLAPDVYLDVVPLTLSAGGLSIGGDGLTVDWLVAMRRLNESQTLENAILEQRVQPRQLDRLAATLVKFYRQATPVFLAAAVLLQDWQQNRLYNRRVLFDPRCGVPSGLITRIDAVQRRFLSSHSELLADRLRNRRIVDGHGDMRPEHIWLDDPVKVIDCLEFNPRLRAVDPFDEIAFLSLECEILGAAWVGKYIQHRVARQMRDRVPQSLFLFYRCQRATLRARLAIAHMLEPNPRTPEKWPRLARAYLRVAAADGRQLERCL